MKRQLFILFFLIIDCGARQFIPPFFSFFETNILAKKVCKNRFDFWTVGYQQHASSIFTPHSLSKRQSLSTLFFGKQNFFPQEAFANQINSAPQVFAFANREIAPRVKWK